MMAITIKLICTSSSLLNISLSMNSKNHNNYKMPTIKDNLATN